MFPAYILLLFYGTHFVQCLESLKHRLLNVQFRLKRDLFDETTKATALVLGTFEYHTMVPILQS